VKIVICSNTSWSIYNFRLNLAKALKSNGYEIVLVAPYDEYSDKLSDEFVYHDIYMNIKGTNPKEDLKTLMGFYKLYKKIKPDLVLNYTIKPNIYGNIACGLLGVKTINNISGLGTVFIKESLVTKVVKWLYRYSLSKSSKVFFQNSDDRELFIANNLVSKEKCDLVPGSGIDTQRTTNTAAPGCAWPRAGPAANTASWPCPESATRSSSAFWTATRTSPSSPEEPITPPTHRRTRCRSTKPAPP